MNRVLPTPTPQDIEATLTAIRNDMSALCLWLGVTLSKAICGGSLSYFPDGERHTAAGGGDTSAEAAAVAWINCVFLCVVASTSPKSRATCLRVSSSNCTRRR